MLRITTPRFLQLYLIALACCFGILNAVAQNNTTTQKPPQLQSFWGYYKSGTHPLEVVLRITDTAIWVIDELKQRYTIRSFRINYFSYDSYEDEATGKIKYRHNLLSSEFRETDQLNELWKQKLYEELKPKDEIHIDLLSVRDKQGRIFYAPDIKIVIQ